MGNYREGSDIDLALKGKDLSVGDILNAQVKLDDLFLPYKFDLVIYDRISKTAFRKHIDKFGVELKSM